MTPSNTVLNPLFNFVTLAGDMHMHVCVTSFPLPLPHPHPPQLFSVMVCVGGTCEWSIR